MMRGGGLSNLCCKSANNSLTYSPNPNLSLISGQILFSLILQLPSVFYLLNSSFLPRLHGVKKNHIQVSVTADSCYASWIPAIKQ